MTSRSGWRFRLFAISGIILLVSTTKVYKMAATICPTVTARSPEEYREQMERVAGFAQRIHIDTADGVFTPVKLTPLEQVWWPANVRADIHVMHQDPFKHTKLLLKLHPQLIVVHAEADG